MTDSIGAWFSALTTFEKVYWYIAIPFSLIFLFQLITTIFGFDSDELDSDSGFDDGGIEFQFLTFKNFVAFLTIFAWSGISCINSGLFYVVTIIVSVLSGLLMMLIMAYLAYSMSKLTEDGTWKIRNALYKTGTVYLTIPANMGGLGKIQIDVQGFKTLDAMTNDNDPIKSGTLVTVVDISDGDILIVSKKY